MYIFPMITGKELEDGETLDFQLTESGKLVWSHYCVLHDVARTPRENIEAAIEATLKHKGLADRPAKRQARKLCDDLEARESKAFMIHAYVFDGLRKRLKV